MVGFLCGIGQGLVGSPMGAGSQCLLIPHQAAHNQPAKNIPAVPMRTEPMRGIPCQRDQSQRAAFRSRCRARMGVFRRLMEKVRNGHNNCIRATRPLHDVADKSKTTPLPECSMLQRCPSDVCVAQCSLFARPPPAALLQPFNIEYEGPGDDESGSMTCKHVRRLLRTFFRQQSP